MPAFAGKAGFAIRRDFLNPPELLQAISLLNRGDYFECHEVLEALWQPLPPGPEKTFYQGLIQVAVGLYHQQRGNHVGAVRKLRAGVEKLRAVLAEPTLQRELHLALPGLDIPTQLPQWEHILADLEAG